MRRHVLNVVVSFCASLLIVGLGATARTDEGMWTFDNFPSGKVAARYGFFPSKAWLDHVRVSVVRLTGSTGCSASFISATGLIMTNHHCAVGCLASLSNATHDYVESGFYAEAQSDEVKCPRLEADRLVSVTDVTAEYLAATKGKSGSSYTDATRAENAKLQKACASDPKLRCDVVTLYQGGVYDLYTYRRYRDVRLAFAPEYSVAQFGGDPDNFNFPRFDFDVSLLRAYDSGQPISTSDYLRWSPHGSSKGELVFVAGNPGGTRREWTISQVNVSRDVGLPWFFGRLAELRGRLAVFATQSPEAARESKDLRFGTENEYKRQLGEFQALLDPVFYASLQGKEIALRAQVAARPDLQREYGRAWAQMAAIQNERARLLIRANYVNNPSGRYWRFAQTLVRLPVEKAKPNEKRLPEFSDAALVTLPDDLFDPSPIYPDLEEVQLAFFLDDLRRQFGPDDPYVKLVLQGRSPAAQAHYLISNTKLADVAYRKALYYGGQASIDASTDPFILLARAADADQRAAQIEWENTVQNPTNQLSERIARARFAITGTSVYPDATFTLRLSYGAVSGFSDDRGTFEPFTTISGLFARASGADPYVLPASWLNARAALDMRTPMNLSTSNDIIGGNSGSPLVNKNAEIVGLIFDGNIHSLGGDFGYDPRLNRAVSVDSRAIIEGLTKVYHANRLVAEILR
ncbi:MAG: S46 family peptidase [Candidatus Eremiobacteraeota bacterium]|nr:S46 family peptidase [Candidatus Eremiobacteraeota bacterium]